MEMDCDGSIYHIDSDIGEGYNQYTCDYVVYADGYVFFDVDHYHVNTSSILHWGSGISEDHDKNNPGQNNYNYHDGEQITPETSST